MATNEAQATQATVTLERVNTPPAQTWNYLRANDITLTVPKLSRKGDVYFALPQLFDRIQTGMGPKVTQWVTSQAADSTYVEVPAHTVRTEPIVVDVDAQKGQVADTGIMVREGATATVVVIAHGNSNADVTSAALTRIVAEANTHVHLYEFVAVGQHHTHLESVGIDADDNAVLDVRQFLLGGSTSAVGFAAALSGDNARIDLRTRYLARGHETLDINHVVRQLGKKTRAEIHESGVLDGSAHKSLRATIDLVHGAKGSKGNEAENVLVCGENVVNKTVPVILCDEDDVQGNHGATIGSVGPDQIHYLEDRGLSFDEIEDLYVRAIFDDAVIQSPTTAARHAVLARAEEVLGAEIADDLLAGLDIEEQLLDQSDSAKEA
ncbi:MAG: SufB/SufD family protein [Atopobiaceae bacterium]